MKIEKKLKKYCENIKLPDVEKVLPKQAVEAGEKSNGTYNNEKIIVSRRKKVSTWRLVPAVVCITLLMCLTVTGVVVASKAFSGKDGAENNTLRGEIDLGHEEIFTEPAFTEMYLPDSDGKYKIVVLKDASYYITENIITKYLALSESGKLRFESQRLEKTDGITEYDTDEHGNGSVTHTPGTATRFVYLTGENIYDDSVFIGLVNTLVCNAFGNYVHVYVNGTEVQIGDELPDKGYSSFKIETSEEYTGSAGGGVADTQNVEKSELVIHVVDKNGKPVPGISVRIEAVSGNMYSYMPGYAMTDYLTGTVKRQGVVGTTYCVHAELLNANSYTPAIERKVIYEVTQTVTLKGNDEVTMVFDWDGKLPEGMKKTVIRAVDASGEPMKGYSISLFAPNGGQIMLGSTDENGEVAWYGCPGGNFTACVTMYDEHDVALYSKNHSLTLEVGCELALIRQNENVVGDLKILE